MSIKSRILIVLLWILPMSALGSSASDSIRSALSRLMDEYPEAAIKERLDEGIYQGEHSRRYVEAYDPHYRLIRRDIFEQRLKPQLDIHLYLK